MGFRFRARWGALLGGILLSACAFDPAGISPTRDARSGAERSLSDAPLALDRRAERPAKEGGAGDSASDATSVDAPLDRASAEQGRPDSAAADLGQSHEAPGDGPSAEAPACPPACASGCKNGVCKLDCSTRDCTCPAGWDCSYSCGPGQCPGDIDCSQGNACGIVCDGKDACTGTVRCGAGPCNVFCNKEGACRGGVVCGTGSCDVKCEGKACAGTVDCADACACSIECKGTGTCAGSVQCPSGCSFGCGPQDSCRAGAC